MQCNDLLISLSMFSLDRCTRTLQPLVNNCRERIDEARRQLDAIGRCEKDIKTVEEHIRDSIMESMADIRRQERQLIQSIPFIYGEEGAKFISEKDSLREVHIKSTHDCTLLCFFLHKSFI